MYTIAVFIRGIFAELVFEIFPFVLKGFLEVPLCETQGLLFVLPSTPFLFFLMSFHSFCLS